MLASISKEKNEPVLKLTGSLLKENGFNTGDIVSIRFLKNEIIVSKNSFTNQLQEMEIKNPSLVKLKKEFNLDLVLKNE